MPTSMAGSAGGSGLLSIIPEADRDEFLDSTFLGLPQIPDAGRGDFMLSGLFGEKIVELGRDEI